MVYLSKIIIPKMTKNKFGSMVHISSVDALSGDDKPQDAYGSSKAAMIRLSKSFAIQFASTMLDQILYYLVLLKLECKEDGKKNHLAKKNLEK